MKLFLLFLLTANAAFAQFPFGDVSLAQDQSITVLCISNTSWGTDTAAGANFAVGASSKYASSSNALAYTMTVCEIGMKFKRTGSGTAGTLTGQIRANGGTSHPGTVLATSLNTIASADVGTSDTWVAFNFPDTVLTANTIYWFGVVSDTTSATDFYTERGGNSSTGAFETSSDGTTWSTVGTRRWLQSGWARGAIILPDQTNSFELLVDFDANTAESSSAQGNTNATRQYLPLGRSGTWMQTTDASNQFYYAALGSLLFPSNYYYTNVLTSDPSTRGLEIHFTNTASQDIQYRLSTFLPLPVSFGFYYIVNVTNTGAGNPQFFDLVYVGDSADHNSAAVEWISSTNSYYAHGVSNDVSVSGSGVGGGSNVADTNWITGQITSSNYTLAIYNPVTWAQVGNNSSVNRGDGSLTENRIDQIRVLSWAHNYVQPTTTNYLDGFVLKTNGLFPIIPTNFAAMNHP